MKVLILADFIVPEPKGGAGIAIINEARQLMKLGFKVVIGTRLASNGKFLNENFLPVSNYLEIHHVNHIKSNTFEDFNIIILNNISLVEIASKFKKAFGSPVIFRKHIDWFKKVYISGEIGIKPKELFAAHKRHSPSKTIKLYQKALEISDLIADVSPEAISLADEKCFYLPPKPNNQFNEACLKSWSITGLSILIGGRLNDPIKGPERIVETLLRANEGGMSLNVHLLGSAPNHLIEILSNRFKTNFFNHGWVNSADEQKKILAKCNIFLTLPYYEPYGLMLEETIRSGLIPVSTPTGLAKHIRALQPEIPILDSSCANSVINDSVAKLRRLESTPTIELLKLRELSLSIPHSLSLSTNTLSYYLTDIVYEKEIPVFC